MKDSNSSKDKKDKDKEYPVPVEDVWTIMDNKYRAIVIASKEARNIFEMQSAKDHKASILALKKLIQGKIKYEEHTPGSDG